MAYTSSRTKLIHIQAAEHGQYMQSYFEFDISSRDELLILTLLTQQQCPK